MVEQAAPLTRVQGTRNADDLVALPADLKRCVLREGTLARFDDLPDLPE